MKDLVKYSVKWASTPEWTQRHFLWKQAPSPVRTCLVGSTGGKRNMGGGDSLGRGRSWSLFLSWAPGVDAFWSGSQELTVHALLLTDSSSWASVPGWPCGRKVYNLFLTHFSLISYSHSNSLAFLPSLLCAAHSLYSVWVIYPCSLRLLNTESLLDTCSVFQANGIKNNATEVEFKISAQKIKAKVHEVPRHTLDSLPVHSLFRGMGRTFTIHQKLLCGLEQWPYFLCLMDKVATGKEASQIREGQGGNLVS